MSPRPAETEEGCLDAANRRIYPAQVRLLYSNANLGVGVTLIAAPILGLLQWAVAPHPLVLGWCLCMILVALGRFALAQGYRRANIVSASRWGAAFAIGGGVSGIGWGTAGVLLYPETHLTNQVWLLFILGGMMLGAASLLAPRPEAFLAFIVPAGLAPAIRLVMQSDEGHRAMGLLAAIFTAVTLATTRSIYLTIASSLKLQFENQDLVEDLRAAKRDTEALNEQLEARVQDRTAELYRSTEQLRDEIARRERIQEELLRARKLESLGVLAGGIAHDFNNFLAIVQGNIEMAKMHMEPHDPTLATLDEIAGACHRANFLSSQLLTFARGGTPVRRSTSVAQLVTDAVQLARAGAQTSIAVSIAGDLHFAEVDPGQIGQVLHNILLNARQAMPEGGIIEVAAYNVIVEGGPANTRAADVRIRISVRDYGCGITADVLPRIFDPYFTTRRGASGLGLATAYAISAKHGGSLSVESKPGHGSTFTIELPASPQAPVPLPSPAAAARSSRLQNGTGRLLVMDDEEGLRNLLHAVLVKLGYEVETARDGAEAIARCEEAKASGRGFDAVLLDLTVSGGMGGAEAALILKELDPSLKLIVSSGYSDAPVMADFRKNGFDAVLPKPWVAAELSEVFHRVLATHLDRNAR